MLLRQLQSRMPLPLTNEAGQLVLRAQLSDSHHHPPTHHCGTLTLLLLLAERPMQMITNSEW